MRFIYREVVKLDEGNTYKDFYEIRGLMVCRITINYLENYTTRKMDNYVATKPRNKTVIFWAMVTDNGEPSTKLRFKLSQAIGDAYSYRLWQIREVYYRIVACFRSSGIKFPFTRRLNHDDLSYDFFYNDKWVFNISCQLKNIYVNFGNGVVYQWNNVTSKAIMQEIMQLTNNNNLFPQVITVDVKLVNGLGYCNMYSFPKDIVIPDELQVMIGQTTCFYDVSHKNFPKLLSAFDKFVKSLDVKLYNIIKIN